MNRLPYATKVTIEHDLFAVDILSGIRTLDIGPEVSPGVFFVRSRHTVYGHFWDMTGVVPAEQLGMLLDCATEIDNA